MSKLLEKINQSKKQMPIGELCSSIFSGGTPTTTNPSFWNGGIPWLSSGETRNDFINNTEKTITKKGVDGSSTKLALKDDVVIATAGQGLTRGQVSYLNIDAYINQSLISLRANPEKLNPQYLYYNLKSRYTELRSLSDDTSSRGSITIPILSRMEIDMHDLSTQERIARILSTYDAKIENNNLILKKTETVVQTLFKEWFVDFRFPGYRKAKFIESATGKIPEAWTIGNIETITKRLPSGKTYRENDLSKKGTSPVYDQSSKGTIGFHNDKPAFNASIENPILIFGDHTCRSQIICEPFSLGPNTIPLAGKDGYDPIFSYFLVKDLVEQREYKRHWNELISHRLIIPPTELVEKWTGIAISFVASMLHCEKENSVLKEARDELLIKLI